MSTGTRTREPPGPLGRGGARLLPRLRVWDFLVPFSSMAGPYARLRTGVLGRRVITESPGGARSWAPEAEKFEQPLGPACQSSVLVGGQKACPRASPAARALRCWPLGFAGGVGWGGLVPGATTVPWVSGGHLGAPRTARSRLAAPSAASHLSFRLSVPKRWKGEHPHVLEIRQLLTGPTSAGVQGRPVSPVRRPYVRKTPFHVIVFPNV